MSGIEIAIGVVGAVSALIQVFKHGHALYREWKTPKTNDNLDRSLITGHHTVQEEYNALFLKLGARFASGDGMFMFVTDPEW